MIEPVEITRDVTPCLSAAVQLGAIEKRGPKPSGWPPGNRVPHTVPPEEDQPRQELSGKLRPRRCS